MAMETAMRATTGDHYEAAANMGTSIELVADAVFCEVNVSKVRNEDGRLVV
jgi:hypothetical protein